MRKLIVAFLGVLFFLVVFVATAPARVSSYFLLDSPVKLQGVSGTLWRGQASRAAVVLPQGELLLGAVSWRLRPLSLLGLAPKVNIKSTWGAQQFDGVVQFWRSGDLRLTNFSANFDAKLVAAFFPLAIDGVVSTQFDHFRIKSGVVTRADGRLVWQQGRWLSPRGPRPLGSYAMDLQSSNDNMGIVGSLVTLAGPVNAEGEAILRDKQYEVDVILRHDRGFEPELSNMLSLMAQPLESGFHVKLGGEL